MTTLDRQQTGVGLLSPAELYAELLAGQPMFILDVRNAEESARNQIRGRSAVPTLNIPYFEFIEDEAMAIARVPTGVPITVICTKEGSSQYVAGLLAEHGFLVRYLVGGFQAWLDFYAIHEVVSADWGKIVQLSRPARGDLSYVIISAGEAAVIDPSRHIHLYQEITAAAQVEISRVLLTHLAAGRLSGGAALANARHTLLYCHPYDALHPRTLMPAHLEYLPLLGGERLPVGQLLIEAHWFPGHTPGHLIYRVITPEGRRFLLTGDALLLRGCGRTDLGGHPETWTELLLNSLRSLSNLADDQTLILPSSMSSLAEARSDGIVAEPFASLRTSHPALQADTVAVLLDFVAAPDEPLPALVDSFWRANLGLWQPDPTESNELETVPSLCILAHQ